MSTGTGRWRPTSPRTRSCRPCRADFFVTPGLSRGSTAGNTASARRRLTANGWWRQALGRRGGSLAAWGLGDVLNRHAAVDEGDGLLGAFVAGSAHLHLRDQD